MVNTAADSTPGAVRLGPRDLLEYEPHYGVLICRKCQYAIQKSAIQSHLLRHKIYRDERQRLLSAVSQFSIREPHFVALPAPSSPPIDGLPIIPGYRCTAAACGNLCASSKRMKLHQREIHGRRELSDLASFARPVKLQTFFRGTKLRYFEVTPLSESDSTIDYDDAEEEEDSSVDVDTAIPLPLPNLDLETLTYFHHFTTATSLTLPVAGDEQSATQNWQTDVVLHALQRQWLMCGLLAISACHLAVLVEDASIRQAHRERSAQFFSAFSAEWEAMKVSKGMSEDKDAMRAGAQIACILRCVHWTPGSTVDPAAVSQLQLFMATIRSFDPDAVSFQSNIHHHVQTVPKNVVEAFNRLHTLPALMAETFSRPDNVQDVLATLTAIAMLIECCDMSFSSSGMGAAWHSMTMWLVRVPEHFNELTRRNSPSALVVIGYWEAILVKRAEDCGCWFLKGLQMAEQVKLELKLGLELGCQALGVPEVVASLLP